MRAERLQSPSFALYAAVRAAGAPQLHRSAPPPPPAAMAPNPSSTLKPAPPMTVWEDGWSVAPTVTPLSGAAGSGGGGQQCGATGAAPWLAPGMTWQGFAIAPRATSSAPSADGMGAANAPGVGKSWSPTHPVAPMAAEGTGGVQASPPSFGRHANCSQPPSRATSPARTPKLHVNELRPPIGGGACGMASGGLSFGACAGLDFGCDMGSPGCRPSTPAAHFEQCEPLTPPHVPPPPTSPSRVSQGELP